MSFEFFLTVFVPIVFCFRKVEPYTKYRSFKNKAQSKTHFKIQKAES